MSRSEFRPHRRKAPDAAVLAEIASLRGVEPGAPSSAAAPSSAIPPEPPLPTQPAGVFRWIVDIHAWKPKPAEWDWLLTQVSEEESKRVMRFIQEPDRKRGLVSRLLQRRACYEVTGLPWASIRIERTKGGKPFLANKPAASAAGMRVPSNWNFNISHEGAYVVLAAEPLALVGVDVAAPFHERPGNGKGKIPTMEENLRVFDDQLTAKEKRQVHKHRPDEVKMEHQLRTYWSLKEAYTKARGDGLGFAFNRIEFDVAAEAEPGASGQPVQRAAVSVDNSALSTWSFFMQGAGADDHWISVARGTPKDVVDANGTFKATFKEKLGEGTLKEELKRPEPPFVTKVVADLVADEARATYNAKAR